MKTKTILSTSLGRMALPSFLSAAAAVGAFTACSGKFKTECPEGTVQQGGGDVDEACVKAGAGGSGGSGGDAGTSGVGGAGGTGGSSQPPPKGDCQAGQKQCSAEGLSECGPDGQWQAPTACEIGCDGAKTECVVPVQLAAGSTHACALLSDGTVRCWGGNSAGQLGNGSDADTTKPVPVAKVGDVLSLSLTGSGGCVATGGKTASCWGFDNIGYIAPNGGDVGPYFRTPVDAGITDVKQAAMGGYSLCVLTETSNSVQCRGSRLFGMLGNGENGFEVSPNFVSVKGITGKTARLAAGNDHTCVLTESKNVFCWGTGGYGQNGSSTDENLLQATPVEGVNDIVELMSSDGFSCAVQTGGAAQCWGANFRGALGRGPQFTADHSGTPGFVVGLSDVKKVASGHGALHVCAVKKDGTVWCWGSNTKGEVGKSCDEIECQVGGGGSFKFVSSPIQSQVTGAVEIAVGGSVFVGRGGFTCALLNDHSVQCWGDNAHGQIGIGRTSDFERTPQRVVWK